MKKYFRFTWDKPFYKLFFRLAFPTTKGNGSFYDVWDDRRLIGPHIRGRVLEIAWRSGKPPSIYFGPWAAQNGVCTTDPGSIVHVPDCMRPANSNQ